MLKVHNKITKSKFKIKTLLNILINTIIVNNTKYHCTQWKWLQNHLHLEMEFSSEYPFPHKLHNSHCELIKREIKRLTLKVLIRIYCF